MLMNNKWSSESFHNNEQNKQKKQMKKDAAQQKQQRPVERLMICVRLTRVAGYDLLASKREPN